jgi:hypothetical protein
MQMQCQTQKTAKTAAEKASVCALRHQLCECGRLLHLELTIEVVDDWFASRHFQSYDLFVRKAIEVLDECSQRITVGDDQNCVGSCERRDARVVFTIASFGPSSAIGLSTNSTLPSPCITNAFMVYVIVDRLLRFISVSEMQSLCRWRKQGESTDLLQTLCGNTQQVLTITQSSPR